MNFIAIGQVVCLRLTFETSKKIKFYEYIHGIILEHVQIIGGEPKKIKVNQIRNLEEYMVQPSTYDNFSERLLNYDAISVEINYFT